ncbi:hypothetical protein GCM10011578_097710 [Streptomyces fuscichromogenes]|uniref:Carrier domain-containing protein n=2 Tax=Streptomyces fuscichromogenes TaxID=1324013 RepID=A0A917XP43_9ACTN|nr:hypothetical protein GCM10011578_097710 [Streptomyces fuscichromogenes]
MRECAGVNDAVVVVDRTERGEPRLVACAAGPAGAEDIRAALSRQLPSAMVPSFVMVLTALLLSVNGKSDRAALPPVTHSAPHAHVAPCTPEEAGVCAAFAHVLGIERVGVHDDFFALGGHSLPATQLVARIRAALAVELPLRSLFEHPTPGLLGGEVRARLGRTPDRGAAAPAVTGSPWFAFPSPRPPVTQPAVRLFCLPHGGGGASACYEWAPGRRRTSRSSPYSFRAGSTASPNRPRGPPPNSSRG